jgi:predicted GTPase
MNDLRAALDAARALLADDTLAPPPQRADLTALDDVRERLDRRFTLAVVGEFSSGKSYLLNALLGKISRNEGKISGLLTVDINPSTATITELEFAEEESAVARYPSGRAERVPVAQLARFVAVSAGAPGALHNATADDDAAPTHVTVRTDSAFLRRGFVIADTPGLASLNPAHRRATLGYLPRTDAVLYLIDTQQPFTDGDAAFLGLIGEHVSAIFIVQTKIDLWRMPESNGKQAWENARDRIVARAAQHAPAAQVFALSSHDFAVGCLDDDAALRESSGFPAFLAALDLSLEERVRNAREKRAVDVAQSCLARTSERLEYEHSLLKTDAPTLRTQRADAEIALAQRENELAFERDKAAANGAQRAGRIIARGTMLNDELVQALSSAFDVKEIAHIRDRAKLHMLVDAAATRVFSAFASETANEIAADVEEIARNHPTLRASERIALGLGGEPGTGAWSRDLPSGIRSTILLDAIGGPTVAFVHAVASAFAAHAHGAYMKRELGIDVRETFFPQLENDVLAFTRELAARIGAVYADLSHAIEAERRDARAQALDPIDRALARANDAAAGAILAAAREKTDDLRSLIAANAITRRTPERTFASTISHLPDDIPFDADVYQNGLNPHRWRVVLLGALRRGKSSLINAIAQTRLMRDEGGVEAVFPIHVRYGAQERAYALLREGEWRQIPLETAAGQAAQSPVLIEVPWKMPRELVLVHAPAFDSGNPHAEEISLTAAAAASEVLALFSRQLSDHEVALYKRVSELGKPILFAHTIADNENPSERRTVVALAERYLRERDVSCSRIFTLSAMDYFEAMQARRAPSTWNELGALRETLATHAEEHMQRLARRHNAATTRNPPQAAATTPSGSPLSRVFARFFKHS